MLYGFNLHRPHTSRDIRIYSHTAYRATRNLVVMADRLDSRKLSFSCAVSLRRVEKSKGLIKYL